MLESVTESYFLEGYEESERVTRIINEEECTIITYKGEHKDEVLVKAPNGVVTLYSLGVKQLEWIEREDSSIGTITFFDKGIVKLVQVREEGETDIVRVTNSIEGTVLEYEDPETKVIVFKGQFNDSYQRDGLGNEYDRQTGRISRQGIWENGKIVKYLRFFNEDEMVEFDPESPNLYLYDLNPIYRGGYCVDEKTGEYLRNGQGYLILNHVTVGISEWDKGKMVSEQKLVNGWYIQPEEPEEPEEPEKPEESEIPIEPPVLRTDVSPPKPVDDSGTDDDTVQHEDPGFTLPSSFIPPELTHFFQNDSSSDESDESDESDDSDDSDESDESNKSDDSDDSEKDAPEQTEQEKDLYSLTPITGKETLIKTDAAFYLLQPTIEILRIEGSSCNSLDKLELKAFANLRAVDVGNECCSRVETVLLCDLPVLRRFSVGKNSFTKEMNGWKEDKHRSFHLLHCPYLESIKINRYSFSDYGGDFELLDLPALKEVEIGVFDEESWNFSNSSCIFRDLPQLRTVVMGDKTFGFSTHTVFESTQPIIGFM